MYVMTDFAWALARKGESQMNATTTPKKKQTAETIDTAASSATAPERQKPDNRRQRSQKAGAARNKAGRKGTKTARVITLLERASGASLKTLMKATGWQAHSVRGFLSGQLGKRMGLRVRSFEQDGERFYSLSK
jgi:hypothetical protein